MTQISQLCMSGIFSICGIHDIVPYSSVKPEKPLPEHEEADLTLQQLQNPECPHHQEPHLVRVYHKTLQRNHNISKPLKLIQLCLYPRSFR